MRVLGIALCLLAVAACSSQPSASTDLSLPYAKFVEHVQAANLPDDSAYELGWLTGIKPQPCYEGAYTAYREAVESMNLNGTTFDLSQVLAKSNC